MWVGASPTAAMVVGSNRTKVQVVSLGKVRYANFICLIAPLESEAHCTAGNLEEKLNVSCSSRADKKFFLPRN